MPQPAVVYNAFPWADRVAIDGKIEDRRDLSVPSINRYSQTLGKARVARLFDALSCVQHEAEIHLRGKPTNGFTSWISERFRSVATPVFMHELVSNDDAFSHRRARHRVRRRAELLPKRDLTVSNKILHYLLGGLAVIASDTAGQRKSRTKPVKQYVFTQREVALLAEILNCRLRYPQRWPLPELPR